MTGIEKLRMLAEIHRGNGSVFMANYLSGIADKIEEELEDEQGCDVETVRSDAMRAWEWVRDHGGLDHVKAEWCSRVPHDRYEQRRRRLLGHIAECETALGRRNVRIEELGHRVGDLTRENAELRRRAMPESCEWPRYESGELVGFGDDVSRHGGDFEANVIALYRDGSFSLNFWAYSKDERVKRPAPAVLAADGEPLEVGQTAWETDAEADTPLTVVEVSSDLVRCEYTWKDGKTYRPCCPPDQLTHQRPVLDAEGVPIRVGDTVWDVETGIEFEVSKVSGCAVMMSNGGYYSSMLPRCDPSLLTHTKPEPKRICGDCRHWQGDPSASHMGVCFNSYRERCCVDSYAAQLDHAKACEDFEERGE